MMHMVRFKELIRSAFYQDACGGCIGMYYVVSDNKLEISAQPLYFHWHLGIMFPWHLFVYL